MYKVVTTDTHHFIVNYKKNPKQINARVEVYAIST